MRLYALILIVNLSLTSAYGFKDIETSGRKIASILQTQNPKSLPKFTELIKEYEKGVIRFFDTTNTESLAQHITYISADLVQLKNACDDPQFASVAPLLSELHEKITDLVTLLKKYVGSKNIVGLSLRVAKFRHLLPQPVLEKGKFALLKSLNHRLDC